MYLYLMFIEALFRLIFFVLLLPYKILSLIMRYTLSILNVLKYKEKVLVELKLNQDKNSVARFIFYQSYDDKIVANWRSFNRKRINRWIISLMVYAILIIRFTMF